MSATPPKTDCDFTGNIPANLLDYVNSFDTSGAEFACSVRTESDLIRVVLTWSYPERCSRKERRKDSETKQCPGGKFSTRQLSETVPGYGTSHTVERNVPETACNGYVMERNDLPNMSTETGNSVAQNFEDLVDNHSGDESTVSVSSLDSAQTSDANIKRRSSRLNSVATDTEDEVAIRRETMTDDESAERRWVENTEITESPDHFAENATDFANASVFSSYCTLPLPSCGASYTAVKKLQNCEKPTAEATPRPALSPIAEATASNNDTDYNSDTTTENAYDVTPSGGEVNDAAVKKASATGGDDVTHGDFPPTSSKKVSVAVFSLNTARGKSPPHVERMRAEQDFVTADSRQLEILRCNRAPTLGVPPGYAYHRVTESQLVKLYKEHMNTLLVVRASKFRLSQKRLDQALIRSGKVDPSHVIDVYYDEIVMTRPAYIVQFKPEFADDITRLITIDGKGAKGVLKLSEDNEVSMSRPQPKMMEIKWRTEFEFP